MPFACLQAQHRMRPEISVMMRPIYNNLMDHDSVLNFEKIKGIGKNIFFVDHQVKEVNISINYDSRLSIACGNGGWGSTPSQFSFTKF